MVCYMNIIKRKFIAVNAIQVTPSESTTIIDYAAMCAPSTMEPDARPNTNFAMSR